MANVFFQYGKALYLFDTKESKIFQIKCERLIEINETKTLQNIRFNSLEIDKNQAYILARKLVR